jgi:hypothetical protein
MQPNGTPIVDVIQYDFQFKAFNVTQNQIEVYLNGNQITQFNFINTVGSFSYNLIDGNNTLLVKATNADGVISKQESIFLKMQISIPTNTISTTTSTITTTSTSTTTSSSSSSETSGKTMVICHIPPGNIQNPQTINIPYSAWSAHYAHGDTKGECPAKTDSLLVSPRPIKNISDESIPVEVKQDTLNKQPINAPRRPR